MLLNQKSDRLQNQSKSILWRNVRVAFMPNTLTRAQAAGRNAAPTLWVGSASRRGRHTRPPADASRWRRTPDVREVRVYSRTLPFHLQNQAAEMVECFQAIPTVSSASMSRKKNGSIVYTVHTVCTNVHTLYSINKKRSQSSSRKVYKRGSPK